MVAGGVESTVWSDENIVAEFYFGIVEDHRVGIRVEIPAEVNVDFFLCFCQIRSRTVRMRSGIPAL